MKNTIIMRIVVWGTYCYELPVAEHVSRKARSAPIRPIYRAVFEGKKRCSVTLFS